MVSFTLGWLRYRSQIHNYSMSEQQNLEDRHESTHQKIPITREKVSSSSGKKKIISFYTISVEPAIKIKVKKTYASEE